MKFKCNKILKTLTTTTALLLFSIPQLSSADVNVHGKLPIPASLNLEGTVEGCFNNPGPFITLSGSMSLGGVDGRLIFRNGFYGPHEHEEDVHGDLILLNAGEEIRFNKQPPLGGVGGNPWIYIQFTDENDKAISDEILLGRCVQGISKTALSMALMSVANVTVPSGMCENHPGPYITVNGEIVLGGIKADLIFKNNEKGTHKRKEEDVSIGLVLLEEGETIQFAKQPPLDGAGGNPSVYFQFIDDEGNSLGKEVSLGKCNKL